jgi:hypothetical protein
MRRTSIVTLLATALLGGPAAARGETAALPAALEGDPALVASIGEDLARRGVAAGRCDEGDAVCVHLTRTERGVVVRARGAGERAVATAETAAALIESWTRGGIADPLLAPRHLARGAAPSPARPAPPPVVQATVVAPAARPSRWRPAFRLSGETAADGQATWWLGVSAGACARVGPLCLGGEARFSRQVTDGPDLPERPLFLPHAPARSDWEGLLAAELPISLGRPSLLLGLAAGVGRRAAVEGRSTGLRSEASVGLAMPLWSQLALQAGLSAALVPEVSRDGAGGGLLRFGLGLRWGLP